MVGLPYNNLRNIYLCNRIQVGWEVIFYEVFIMDDEQRRQLLLAELDSTIRKREARHYIHKEIFGKVVTVSLLLVTGFCCGMGLLFYFGNIFK